MADIAGGHMQGSVQGHWQCRWDAGISSEGDASTPEIKQTSSPLVPMGQI